MAVQMKRKIKEKLRAIELREKGYSLKEIVDVIGVAKSSVSGWVRNVPLDSRARERLLTKIKKGQLMGAEVRRNATKENFQAHYKKAEEDLNSQVLNKQMARILCSLIYWCEGGKNSSNGVRFTNSDPVLIKTFLTLLRENFDIDEDKFRVGLHLHEYHNPKIQLAFWSKASDIKSSQFIRPYLKPHTGKRIKKDYPGCANIYYYSNDIARQLLATAKVFLNKMGA